MGYAFQKLVWTLAQPSNILLLLLLLGTALLWTPYLRWGRRVLLGVLVALVVVAVSPLTDLVGAPLEDYFPALEPLPEEIAGIVVLGGAERAELFLVRGQVVLNASAERLIAAVVLVERYPEVPVLFTGGSSAVFGSEGTGAEVARMFFVQFGLEEPRLILEDQSRDTFENARLSFDLVQPQAGDRWLLVTSARHMPRSVSAFESAGWQVIPYPVDYRTTGQWVWFSSRRPLEKLIELDQAVTEWVGLLAYRLTGRTERLLPLRE